MGKNVFPKPVDCSDESKESFLSGAPSDFAIDERFYRADYISYGHVSENALSFKGFITYKSDGTPIHSILRFNFSNGAFDVWRDVKFNTLNERQRKLVRENEKEAWEKAHKKRKEDSERRRFEVAEEFSKLPLMSSDDPHLYLKRKNLTPAGYERTRVSFDGLDELMIPLYNFDGGPGSCLSIVMPGERKNPKMNAKGVGLSGFYIPSYFDDALIRPILFIAESYSTARAVEMAINEPCIGICGKGRFEHVLDELKKYGYRGQIILLPDLDADGGAEASAIKAIAGTTHRYALPKFKEASSKGMTDWCDLMNTEGVEEVKSQLQLILNPDGQIDNKLILPKNDPLTGGKYTIFVEGWKGNSILVKNIRTSHIIEANPSSFGTTVALSICNDEDAWLGLASYVVGKSVRVDTQKIFSMLIDKANNAELLKVSSQIRSKGIYRIAESKLALLMGDLVYYGKNLYNEGNLPWEISEQVRVRFTKPKKGQERISYTPAITLAGVKELYSLVEKLQFDDKYVAQFLLAMLFQAQMPAVMKVRPVIHFRAPPDSGKTTLLEILLGLIFNLLRSSDPSKTGAIQLTGGDASALFIDEMDAGEQEAVEKKKKLITFARDNFSEGDQTVRGTPGGSAICLMMNFSILFASIEEVMSLEADKSRTIPFFIGKDKRMAHSEFKKVEQRFNELKKEHIGLAIAKRLTDLYPAFLINEEKVRTTIEEIKEENKRKDKQTENLTTRASQIFSQVLGLHYTMLEQEPCIIEIDLFIKSVSKRFKEYMLEPEANLKAVRCMETILQLQSGATSVRGHLENLCDWKNNPIDRTNVVYDDRQRSILNTHNALRLYGIYFDTEGNRLFIPKNNVYIAERLGNYQIMDYAGALNGDEKVFESLATNTIWDYSKGEYFDEEKKKAERKTLTGYWFTFDYSTGNLIPKRKPKPKK